MHRGAYRRTDRRRAGASDWEKIVELVRSTSATADPRVIVDVPIPRIMTEQVLQRTMEQITDVPVPPVVEEKCAGCPNHSPKERISKRVSQLVDEPVPQNLEEIVELVGWTNATADRRVCVDVFFHRIMERGREQIVAVPVPRCRNKLRKQKCARSKLVS